MALINVFWSYARFDDNNDSGKIHQLFDDINKEYQAITGENSDSSFIDLDIQWGDDWKKVISQSISNLPFFIAVITPSYFKSPNCMDELRNFLNIAKKEGDALLLPIYYIQVDDFPETDPNFVILRKILATNYKDWRSLRLNPRNDHEYRRAVNAIAIELRRRNIALEDSPLKTINESENDDSLGLIDQVVDIEEVIDDFVSVQEDINTTMDAITNTLNRGSSEIREANSHNQPMSAKLILMKKAARELEAPVDELFELSKKHALIVESLDRRIIAYFELMSIIQTEENIEQICKLEESLNDLAESFSSTTSSLQSTMKDTELIARMTRDFRPIIRKQNTALTLIQESNYAFKRWGEQIKTLGLRCN